MQRLGLVLSLCLAACGGSLSSIDDAQDVSAPLVAKGGNHQIALHWKAVKGAKSYAVLRGDLVAGPFAQVASVAATSWTDTALPAATKYYYVVKAGSAAATAPVAALTAPGPVANLRSAFGGGQASLAWDAAPTATGYVVSRSRGGNGFAAVKTVTALSWTDTGEKGALQYTVQARNDGGPGDAVLVTGSADALAVTGVNPDVYVTDKGETPRMDSAEGWDVKAIAGGVTYAGLGTADGRFTIPGVPQGAYWLGFGGTTYLRTSARVVNTGSAVLGRADATYSEQGASLLLDVQGLAPWTTGDWMQLYSEDAGLAALDIGDGFDSNQPPAAGATSLSGYALSIAAGNGLVDAAKGDTALLTQLSWQALAGTQNGFHSISRAFAPAPFTLVDGQQTAVSGNFAEVPQDRALSLSFHRSAYAAHLAEVGPGAHSNWSYAKIFTGPELEKQGAFGGTPNVAYFSFDFGDADQSVGFSYGNPFPESWATFASVTYPVQVPFALPGLRPVVATGNMTVVDRLDRMASIDLRLSPPLAVTVSGGTVAWQPPAVGHADAYTVYVYHLLPDGSGGTRAVRAATLMTADTQAAVPAGLLTAGETYYAYIKARSQPGLDPIALPYFVAPVSAVAGAFSAAFQP